MKKLIFTLSVICFLAVNSKAVIHHIGVDGCSFNPSVHNGVNIGDTIHWFLDANTPRRTSSMNIPPGALAWDALLDTSNPNYYYVVTTPGQYFYKSNIMPTCIASFNVSAPLGLKNNQVIKNVCMFFPNPAKTSFLLIHPKNATSIELYDIEGKLVKEEALDIKETNDEILLSGLKAGNYILNVKQKRTIIYSSKLIIVE